MPHPVSSQCYPPLIYRWAGADVEIRANGGSSCCTAAAASGKSGMLLALSRSGRADLSAAGAEGRTPLQVAVEGGHEAATCAVRRTLGEGSPDAASSAVEGGHKGAAGVVRTMLKGGGSLEATISAAEGLRLHSADGEVPMAEATDDDLSVLPNGSEGHLTGAPFPPPCGEERPRCDSGVEEGSAEVTVLIDASADHPGAGSFLVDGALTPSDLARLRALYATLEDEARETAQRHSQATEVGLQQQAEGTGEGPSAVGSETLVAPASITQQGHPRPVFSDAEAAGESARYGGVERRYFCDAEGWVRAILGRALERAGPLLGGPLMGSHAAVHHAAVHPAAVHPPAATAGTLLTEAHAAVPSAGAGASGALPYMRFLHYRAEGASMAPHVDLSKKAPGDQVGFSFSAAQVWGRGQVGS